MSRLQGWLAASNGWQLLPLRLVIGYGFAAHGYAKLARGPANFAAILTAIGVPLPEPMAWLTSLLELVGGVSLMVGAGIALLSLPLVAVMLTAMFGVHLRYGFSSIRLKAFGASGAVFGPVGYELNLLYIAGLVVLALSAASPLSVDRWLQARRRLTSGSRRPWRWREVSLRDPDGHEIRLYFAGRNRRNPPWRLNAPPSYRIRLARPDEVPRIRQIEDEAGTIFSGLGLINETLDVSFPLDDLVRLVGLGQVWVATVENDFPVGVVIASVRDGVAYVEEMGVLPAHGQRGLGGRLLATVCRWAQTQGHSAVTLSTFRDVRWNGPFYRKHDFRDLQPAEWTPSMQAIREKEAQHGLRVEARVFMRRDLVR